MTTPLATPATTDSSTLYFGPWYRRSPFFEKTLEAGCSAYDIYNHMYLPGYYADPVEEYWALLNVGTAAPDDRHQFARPAARRLGGPGGRALEFSGVLGPVVLGMHGAVLAIQSNSKGTSS